jgi:hypothetical protein
MKSLEKYRTITLLAGIAVAFILVFSQLFYFQAADYCQKKAETQQQDKRSGNPESYISLPSTSIISSSTIEINQDLSFILEILLDDEASTTLTEEAHQLVDKFFQALFRVIISPNAP